MDWPLPRRDGGGSVRYSFFFPFFCLFVKGVVLGYTRDGARRMESPPTPCTPSRRVCSLVPRCASGPVAAARLMHDVLLIGGSAARPYRPWARPARPCALIHDSFEGPLVIDTPRTPDGARGGARGPGPGHGPGHRQARLANPFVQASRHWLQFARHPRPLRQHLGPPLSGPASRPYGSPSARAGACDANKYRICDAEWHYAARAKCAVCPSLAVAPA